MVFTLLMVIGLLLAWGGMHQHLLIKKPLLATEASFEIKKGDSLGVICTHLADQNIAIHPFWFKLYAFQHHLARQLKAGEYILPKDATGVDILQIFAEGKTRQYSITFPEGWLFRQVFQSIKNNPNLQHTLADAETAKMLVAIGSDKKHPEGLFFPDTYFFEKNTLDVDLLKRAHDRMLKVLSEEWQNRDAELPLENPYQALILASIVEKETAAVEERKQIAGVFTRRLKKGMLLQTDPTVIYGMGDEYHGDIHARDLREPTPYNTYVNSGLPPTPIAMPGRAAISAALHPDKGDTLYFVSRGNGHHAFSTTLSEHEKYVERYQR
jgi:UPF0755 protein